MQPGLLNQDITVVTPEQVQLRFRTAGVGSRAGAQTIDLTLLGLFFALLFVIFGDIITRINIGGSTVSEYLIAVAIIVVAVVLVGYFVVCESIMGQTIGGRIVGLRVIQDNGQPVTLLSSLIRNFIRLIDFLPLFYGVGLLVSFFHPKGKRLGDLLAGTVVIYSDSRSTSMKKSSTKQQELLAKEGWSPQSSFQLEDYQRRLVSREDWIMLEEFVSRRNQLSLNKLRQMAGRMAHYYANKLDLSVDSTSYTSSMNFLLSLYQELHKDWEL